MGNGDQQQVTRRGARSAWPVVVCAAIWLALRFALWCVGGEFGSAFNVPIDGRDVSVLYLSGATPSNAVLVVNHGATASKETLLAACWEARQHGVDCLAVDSLGHGASGPLPAHDAHAAMRDSLRRSLPAARAAMHAPPAERVMFIGHSLGAYLGCGGAFPCDHAMAIGQDTRCGANHRIFGNVHRTLGLGESFYGISHTLEPWTPSVVATALEHVLPSGAGVSRRMIALRVVLAWSALAFAIATAIALARVARGRLQKWPALRGLVGACIVWLGIAAGSYRTLWFTLPTQRTDVLVIGAGLVASLAIAAALRAVGMKHARWASPIAFGVVEAIAIAAWLFHPVRDLRHLLSIPIGLLVVPALFGAVSERVTRTSADLVEAVAFESALLATFLALLVPGV